MYKSDLPTRKTFHTQPAALALLLAGVWLPSARADIYVGTANTTLEDVVSFSAFTGAPKLDIANNGITSGVAFGPDGNLYVADDTHGTVLRFNPVTGAAMGTLVSAGSGLSQPNGMTFGSDGNLYVSDFANGVVKFNGSTGAFMAANPNGPAGALWGFDVKYGPDGNIYVSDVNSGEILKFGTNLAYIGGFASVPGNFFYSYPLGIAFGLNGNLYAIWYFQDVDFNEYNELLEFNGSTGVQVSGFVDKTSGDYLAFGPDGHIYVPEANVITKYNAVTPGLGAVFTADSRIGTGTITFGGPSGIPPYVTYNPVHLTSTQTIRLTVIDGPVPVGPGTPVEAQLGFQNSEGAMVGPSQVVTLNPGQTASLDLPGSSLISSGRIQVVPVVTSLPGTPLGSLQGSMEIYNSSNGIGSVFVPGIPVPPSSPISGYPSFLPQGVALGQSILINALAPPDSPCSALLSFTDSAGNPIGPTQQVNLNPGMATELDFNPNKYTKSGRQEYVPQITPINGNASGAPGVASACFGSAEVYVTKSGDISTYQTSSPAVGTTTAVP
jgi:sugar lactone lactonase YvrE